MQKSLHLFMKLSASLILMAIMVLPSQALAQFNTFENFNNLTLGSTPGDGSFMGQNSMPWYYYNCRGDVPIIGNALTLGVGGTTSSLTCYQLDGSAQNISFDLMQVGPDAATVFVLVNNAQVIALTTSVQNQIVRSPTISISTGGSECKVEFVTAEGGKEVAIDNIFWSVGADNVETFDNLAATNDFEDGSFTGENGHFWEYYYGMEGLLDGHALVLSENGGSLKCEDINEGMYSLSFDYVQRNNYQPVYLEIRINGEVFTTISSDSQYPLNTGELIVDQAFGIDGFPLSIEIAVAYDEDNDQEGGEVTLDNIAWTDRPYTYTEFTGSGNWSDVSRWSSGFPDANSHAFIIGAATLDVVATADYVGIEPEGTLDLQQEVLTSRTLTIRADATGSGSLIGSSSFLNLGYAFMEWHTTSGVSEAWHLLSSPVPNQSLISNGNTFAPTGSGYDFYAWDEPTEMWLNRKVPANNINSFIPGKGYLVAYEDISADKFFGSYTFNSGTITVPITGPGFPGKSSNGIHSGANLIGNPYPSSIDWKSLDLDKNNLSYDNGYNLYIWNDAVSNYGTYSSGNSGSTGTNGAGQYIPPLQGFFVMTQGGGNVVFNDGARVHSSQLYMKSGNEEGFRLSVQAPGDAGKDEILLDFGHEANQGGAEKWNSMSDKAPSMYVTTDEKDYSIRFLSSVNDNPIIPVAFKAGMDGEYSIRANFSTAAYPSVKLKDLLTGNIHDLSTNPEYSFTATTDDDANRFALVFGTLGVDHPQSESEDQVYAHGGLLYLNRQTAGSSVVKVYTIAGQLLMEERAGGQTLTTLNASHLSPGIYLVNVVTDEKVISHKVAFTK